MSSLFFWRFSKMGYSSVLHAVDLYTTRGMHINDWKCEIVCNQSILLLCIKYIVCIGRCNYMPHMLTVMELNFDNIEQQMRQSRWGETNKSDTTAKIKCKQKKET